MTPFHDELAATYRAARARLSPRQPKPLAFIPALPPPTIIDLAAHIGTKARARAIVDAVAAKHSITAKEILSSFRDHHIALARAEASYRMRNEITVHGKPMSYPMIGAALNRDHTTILWQVRKWHEEHAGREYHDDAITGGD